MTPSPDVIYRTPGGAIVSMSADDVQTVVRDVRGKAIILTADEHIQTSSQFEEVANQIPRVAPRDGI